MARTVAPLLSFNAGGQIAKTQVYATWKGRPYVRRYVVPSNPNTAQQQMTRNVFSWLMQAWKFWPAGAIDAWDAYADSLRITNRNAFAKLNVSPLREQTTVTAITLSPAAKSGIVAQAAVPTPGAGQITMTLTPPDLPNGWEISRAYALAIPQQDPTTEQDFRIASAFDDTAPWAPVITGLEAGQLYVVGGWFRYLKPDGSFAFGQSVQSTSTPT